MTYRHILGVGGVPVQQSLTYEEGHQKHLQMSRSVLGVVWEVRPSDHFENRHTRGKAARGAFHTCSVIILNDGLKCNYFLENVVITSDRPTGLDDYAEHMPRPSTKRVTGEALQPKLQGVDPYELDGDWCIVDFIGGNLDMPYIVKWWPHPKNMYDAATSGRGNPDRDGQGQALIQHERVFQRVNGVEQVITAEGDVYLSTRWANSTLKMGEEAATEGRWPRQEREAGGSIHVTVKPSQSLEVTWRKQAEGSGVRDGQEDDLPQTNPPRTSSTNTEQLENLYLFADKDNLKVAGKSVNLKVSERFVLESEGSVTISADSTVDVTAESATITVDTDLNLGGTGGNTLIDSRWQNAWAGLSAVTELPAGTPAQNAAVIEALQGFLTALQTALASSLTQKTKAL